MASRIVNGLRHCAPWKRLQWHDVQLRPFSATTEVGQGISWGTFSAGATVGGLAGAGIVYFLQPLKTVPAVAEVKETLAPPPSPPATVPLDEIKRLARRIAHLEISAASAVHSAFVFIKPHAVCDPVKGLTESKLEQWGIRVVSEGVIPSERIDKEQLIDTHYGAIASKAVKQKPSELTVQPKAQEEFKKAFGIEWKEALDKGLVFNAVDGAAKLNISTAELGEKWEKQKRGVDQIKFGGGFYCGKVEDIFVINGFYMEMRSKFTAPGTSIHYYQVEWDPHRLSWADFRSRVLGGTDPKTAQPGSLRNLVFHRWKDLGLKSCPDTGDNGLHASASPFEAFAERANWLGVPLEEDIFGRALVASGVPEEALRSWCDDPPVSFKGKKQSLFDLLEDTDAKACLKQAAAIAAENA